MPIFSPPSKYNYESTMQPFNSINNTTLNVLFLTSKLRCQLVLFHYMYLSYTYHFDMYSLIVIFRIRQRISRCFNFFHVKLVFENSKMPCFSSKYKFFKLWLKLKPLTYWDKLYFFKKNLINFCLPLLLQLLATIQVKLDTEFQQDGFHMYNSWMFQSERPPFCRRNPLVRYLFLFSKVIYMHQK